MLLWPRVCCFSWMLYTRMLLWVTYTNVNFQDILGAIQCSREYKEFLKSISIHFNCSFMQLEQQTPSHNNIRGLVDSRMAAMHSIMQYIFNIKRSGEPQECRSDGTLLSSGNQGSHVLPTTYLLNVLMMRQLILNIKNYTICSFKMQMTQVSSIPEKGRTIPSLLSNILHHLHQRGGLQECCT